MERKQDLLNIKDEMEEKNIVEHRKEDASRKEVDAEKGSEKKEVIEMG